MQRHSATPEVRAVTRGPRHHWFGYYDKTPWDVTGRHMLALEAGFMDRPPGPDDVATVGLIDTADGDAWQPIAGTTAWNWQQGTMLHWLPSAPGRLIVYNARRGGRFVAVVRDILSGEERTLPRAVYALSPDGRTALSTSFARIADTRPGYGYAGVEDPWRHHPHPDQDGIYRMDLESGDSRLIISLGRIASYRRDDTMADARHWFNHLQVNTDGSRFGFLHRWSRPQERGWRTRLFTANPDGSEIYCVADHEMVSHYDWRDPTHVLAWARQRGVGDHYFLCTDRDEQRETVGKDVLTADGHCSYSPDRQWVLTDEYADSERMRILLLYRPEDGSRVEIGRFCAPPELAGEIRCDLHPRWSRDGTKVCFDSAHESTRQVYVMDVSAVIGEV